jgi:hypothetical protein
MIGYQLSVNLTPTINYQSGGTGSFVVPNFNSTNYLVTLSIPIGVWCVQYLVETVTTLDSIGNCTITLYHTFIKIGGTINTGTSSTSTQIMLPGGDPNLLRDSGSSIVKLSSVTNAQLFLYVSYTNDPLLLKYASIIATRIA